MSKPFKPFLFCVAIFVQILQFLNNTSAQTVEIRVKIDGLRAEVAGTITDNGGGAVVTNFSLSDSVAGQSGLAGRHSRIDLRDAESKPVAFRELAPGELLAERGFSAFRYETDLKPLSLTAMAHSSWIEGGRGVIACADFLPKLTKTLPIDVQFELPVGWRIAPNVDERKPNVFRVNDSASTIFFIGNSFRTLETPRRNATLVIDGEFLFSDAEAAAMTGEIIDAYAAVFGSPPARPVSVFIARYPVGTRAGRWDAESRGSAVLVMSADMLFSTQSVQRLHEQLRHEIFHLWMPNELSLAGDYDWFYEGFALYQSLRTAVAMNRIRFDDFLDTLGRAYDSDSMLSARKSLIESSRNRWSGANTHIYARGMIVAFLVDLAMLSKSGSSVSDLLRTVWRDHRIGTPSADGNEAILRIFGKYPNLRGIVARYIRGSEPIEWQTDLRSAGIESRTENLSTRLSVAAKPNGRQKDLLDKLGYNNWRNFKK